MSDNDAIFVAFLRAYKWFNVFIAGAMLVLAIIEHVPWIGLMISGLLICKAYLVGKLATDLLNDSNPTP